MGPPVPAQCVRVEPRFMQFAAGLVHERPTLASIDLDRSTSVQTQQPNRQGREPRDPAESSLLAARHREPLAEFLVGSEDEGTPPFPTHFSHQSQEPSMPTSEDEARRLLRDAIRTVDEYYRGARDLPGPVRVRREAGDRRGRLRLRVDRRRVRRRQPTAGRSGRGHAAAARGGPAAGRADRLHDQSLAAGRGRSGVQIGGRPVARGSGRGTSAPAASTTASRRSPGTSCSRKRTPARSSARTSPRT